MKELTLFDPSVGSGILETQGVNVNEQLMLYNDSIYRIRFHFNDGSIGIVPALWNKDYIIKTVPLGRVKWEVIDQLNIANNPFVGVYGEVYEPDEHVASVNASMQRSVVSSIPGGVNTVGSTLVNTSSVDATPNIIQIADSLGNTHTLSNDGLMLLASKVAAVLVQQIKTNNVEPLLQLGAAAHMTEVLGNLTVDGTETVSSSGITSAAASDLNLNAVTGQQVSARVNGGNELTVAASDVRIPRGVLGKAAAGDILDASGAADVYIKAFGGNFNFQSPSGTTIFTIRPAGPALLGTTKLSLLNGTLARIGFAAFTGLPSGIQTLTHNFGFVPQIALWQGGNIANTNPGTTTASIYNILANTCTLNNFAAVNGFLLYLGAS